VNHVRPAKVAHTSVVVENAIIGRAVRAGASVDIMNEIPAQDCSGLGSERVNASAVGVGLHLVIDVIVSDR
jgi:hypothetical protein